MWNETESDQLPDQPTDGSTDSERRTRVRRQDLEGDVVKNRNSDEETAISAEELSSIWLREGRSGTVLPSRICTNLLSFHPSLRQGKFLLSCMDVQWNECEDNVHNLSEMEMGIFEVKIIFFNLFPI